MKGKKQYRVIAGVHRENGVEKKVGEVVESDKDLIRLFPNKFVRVHPDEVPVKEPEAVAPPIPAPDEVKNTSSKKKDIPIKEEGTEGVDDGLEGLDDDDNIIPEVRKKLSKKDLATLAKSYGKNVTGTYRDDAERCGVVIFRNVDRQYHIIDTADQKPLREKAMSKQAMVRLLQALKG